MTDSEQYIKNRNKFHRHPKIIAARKQYRANAKIMPERIAWAKFQAIATEIKTEITGII